MADGLRTYDGGVAIVTGAASGIGRAVSEALAQRGCQVVLADIDGADAEAVAAGIRDAGGRASARPLDVTRFADVDQLVARTVEEHGRLDYVFNNAGIGVGGEAADYTMAAWDHILGVNLRGVIHGVQSAYPVMLRQGFGHIVNTASMAGLTLSPGMIGYATTKHAVVALSLALRAEAESHGVRVSVLCPGVIRTPLLQGGRHGMFMGRIPEPRMRVLAREFFERLRPMAPPVFASKVLDQLARDKVIVIVPAWWRLLWWMTRLSPALALRLARRGYEQSRRVLAAEEAGQLAGSPRASERRPLPGA